MATAGQLHLHDPCYAALTSAPSLCRCTSDIASALLAWAGSSRATASRFSFGHGQHLVSVNLESIERVLDAGDGVRQTKEGRARGTVKEGGSGVKSHVFTVSAVSLRGRAKTSNSS